MSKATTAEDRAPEVDDIPLGRRNPDRAKRSESRVRCEPCGRNRWAQIPGSLLREVREAGWLRLCPHHGALAREELRRAGKKEKIASGSIYLWGKWAGADHPVPTLCGICDEEHPERTGNTHQPGRRAFCEGCTPWARLAVTTEQIIAGPSAERDAIYKKIRRILRALKADIQDAPADARMPFCVLAQRWLDTEGGGGTHASLFVRLVALHFADKPIGKVTAKDISVFRSQAQSSAQPTRTKRGAQPRRSPHFLNRLVGVLRRVYDYAVRRGWVASNPAADVALPPWVEATPAVGRLVTVEEEGALLASCVGKFAHLRLPIITLIDTGMNDSERVRLRRADIDLESGLIVRVKCRVEMTPRLREELRAILDSAGRGSPESKVFDQRDIKFDVWSVARAAGLCGLRLTDLRRTAAWRMAQAGRGEAYIAAAVGVRDLNKIPALLRVDAESERRELSSPNFAEFMRAQFGVSLNGDGLKNGGAVNHEAAKMKRRGAWLLDAVKGVIELWKIEKQKPHSTPEKRLAAISEISLAPYLGQHLGNDKVLKQHTRRRLQACSVGHMFPGDQSWFKSFKKTVVEYFEQGVPAEEIASRLKNLLTTSRAAA